MGMDIYGRKPEHENGEYFRRNIWGWRPLHYISPVAIDKYALKCDTQGWGSNDGMGLKNKSQCHKLAKAIEKVMDEWWNYPEDSRIYLQLNCWVKEGGQFIDLAPYKEQIEALDLPFGSIMISGITMSDGVVLEPAYCTTVYSVKQWVQFLYACGGFKIY